MDQGPFAGSAGPAITSPKRRHHRRRLCAGGGGWVVGGTRLPPDLPCRQGRGRDPHRSQLRRRHCLNNRVDGASVDPGYEMELQVSRSQAEPPDR